MRDYLAQTYKVYNFAYALDQLSIYHMIDIMWLVNYIILQCILFIFIKIKFVHCHSYVMFIIKSMSTFNN